MTGSKNSINPCQLKHGCFGCCGHHFKEKKDVALGLRKNELDYQRYDDKHAFMKREKLLRWSGICYNLGKLPNGKLGCLVYDIDRKLRESETGCEEDHECITLFVFKKWDKKKQLAFKKFIEELDIDWYDFSVQMDNGKLMAKFLKGYNETGVRKKKTLKKKARRTPKK